MADKNEEKRQFQQRLRISPALVHDIVREEGEQELQRGFPALWWSGLAAGLSMGLSPLAAGILAALLPAQPWVGIIVAFGYSAGFLIVVLGRQQLFTENTITALLPVMNHRNRRYVLKMFRLWGIVLVANLAGAAIVATLLAATPLLPEHYSDAIAHMSNEYLERSPLGTFLSAIVAGWLVAALVWTMPSVPTSRFALVLFFTWLIGIGHFARIIAGAVGAFFLVVQSAANLVHVTSHFLLPALLGNVMGGSALFALISYAQVRKEVDPE
ncbi:MAG: formate/nitrite transporter family protein [Lamprobacter sp.]|uniref:formate/nitrite transporter family protein n=1 Tax=Lamprobacter sp. TaxID=3100796 RepID=UPI002B2641B0|nr:formate/nitrite transporter family protein [Lamprobacter sp.]MEA3643382.1 formate/nitrite transporter family protein [Lamprobacter sp.]